MGHPDGNIEVFNTVKGLISESVVDILGLVKEAKQVKSGYEVEIEEIKESYNKLKLFINSKTNQDVNETVMANQSLKDNI